MIPRKRSCSSKALKKAQYVVCCSTLAGVSFNSPSRLAEQNNCHRCLPLVDGNMPTCLVPNGSTYVLTDLWPTIRTYRVLYRASCGQLESLCNMQQRLPKKYDQLYLANYSSHARTSLTDVLPSLMRSRAPRWCDYVPLVDAITRISLLLLGI